jgi:diaminohydroxyphosphoribosylaminopyrimidine deaminase/5-amino-6-(5-phosphoribosylamino)uracil reductase
MHERFMLAALDQAQKGRGQCAPNPSVGAVAVRHGQIIAQAWHRGAGSAHAERLLLAELPENCDDITIYVTLEPCNHWGKTPPCVDALIERRVKSVVYGYTDPNVIVVDRDTPKLLRDHGIEVVHFPMKKLQDFYESYHHWTLTKKPWVTVKFAQTFDGKIAGEGGEPVLLSNSLCAEFTHIARLKTDIILTTNRTIEQDDPALTARLKGEVTKKPVAILDRSLTLSKKQPRIFESAQHCYVYHDATLQPAPRKNCTFRGINTCDNQLDLNAVFSDLAQLGFHDVWVEAGAQLCQALHLKEIVNRTHVYLVPKILGCAAISAYHNDNLFEKSRSLHWMPMGDNVIATIDF